MAFQFRHPTKWSLLSMSFVKTKFLITSFGDHWWVPVPRQLPHWWLWSVWSSPQVRWPPGLRQVLCLSERNHSTRAGMWAGTCLQWAEPAVRRPGECSRMVNMTNCQKNISKSFSNFQQRLLCLPRWGGCQKKEVILEENRKNILNSKSLFMTIHKKLQLATILLIFFNKSWLFWIIIFKALLYDLPLTRLKFLT